MEDFNLPDNLSEPYGELRIMGKPAEEKPSVSRILVGVGTPLACTSCHRVDMPFYYLKRSNGKYDVLCYDNGRGCWERSGRSLCSHIDLHGGTQCEYLAEWVVVYGDGNDQTRRAVCALHVPAVLQNAPAYRIYPIDDDQNLNGLSAVPAPGAGNCRT